MGSWRQQSRQFLLGQGVWEDWLSGS